ncbi:formylglycine-generating enzyme family protein [Candidatus Poribacteria bacterium]|nr:formylglycine-generating enzyme family protein [Candidatus Poribacteria bacterium]
MLGVMMFLFLEKPILHAQTGDPQPTVPKDMVRIPAGEFQMGSNDADSDEKPVHTVYVDAFFMDTHEVTVGQYKRFISATGHRALPDWVSKYSPTDRHPVVGISWHDAMAYAQWAGKRLPTEAEWEYAARGGLAGKEYPWGDTLTHDNANYPGTGGRDQWKYTAPVGSFPANGYGLYDMAGNVWEWCLDEYDKDFYANSESRNPVAGGVSISDIIKSYNNSSKIRVVRGGTFTPCASPTAAGTIRLTPATVMGFVAPCPVSPVFEFMNSSAKRIEN